LVAERRWAVCMAWARSASRWYIGPGLSCLQTGCSLNEISCSMSQISGTRDEASFRSVLSLDVLYLSQRKLCKTDSHLPRFVLG
jgi:hypothetical protein